MSHNAVGDVEIVRLPESKHLVFESFKEFEQDIGLKNLHNYRIRVFEAISTGYFSVP